MIIVIRGTSGSGKTYLVRKIMEELGSPDHPLAISNSMKGKFVHGGMNWVSPRISVVGDYNANCGGCDKFSWKGAASDVISLVREQHLLGNHVIFEGLMVSQYGTARLVALNEVSDGNLIAINLSTSPEVCLDSVRARREEMARVKGVEAQPLDPHNTLSKIKGIDSVTVKNRAAGIQVEVLDREDALLRVRELVGLFVHPN